MTERLICEQLCPCIDGRLGRSDRIKCGARDFNRRNFEPAHQIGDARSGELCVFLSVQE